MCFLTYIAPTKRCHKCKEPYPWESFSTDKRSPDGMHALCKTCSSLKQKALYEKHQASKAAAARQRRIIDGDTLRTQARARYVLRREHFLAGKRADYAANPEKMRARNRANHAKRRDKHVVECRRRYAAHPEKWVEWRADNLPTVRLIASRRRARRRALPATFTLTERQFMLEYWHHACAICGNQEGLWWSLSDDHWTPVSSPNCPGTVAENIIPLCHARKGARGVEGTNGCNNSKNDREPEVWLASCYTPAQAKRLLKAVQTYFTIVKARQGQEVAS